MKSAFSNIAVKYLLLILVAALIPAVAGAQGSGQNKTADININDGITVKPYQSYAEFALDMFLNQMAGRGLDVSIDPDKYIVGPGDRIGIYFVSNDISDMSNRISADGKLFFKSVGAIDTKGKTLRETIDEVRAAVNKSYSGTGFDVQLVDFRFARINIIGEVARPGLYYVPAVWRVSEVLDLAGGLTEKASTRRIILRGDDNNMSVDLLKFKKIGIVEANPFVCKGHTIIVPDAGNSDQYITISGLIRNPGIFEFVAGDRIEDFILYADGPDGNLSDMTISVTSASGEKTGSIDGNDAGAMSFTPSPGDNISLAWKNGRESFGNVTILGEVNRPGMYPITTDNFNLENLLRLCGGVTTEGCPEMISIYRLVESLPGLDGMNFSATDNMRTVSEIPAASGENRRQLVSFNPRKQHAKSEILLSDNDSLYVPRASGMVSIMGAVVSPGLVSLHKGKDVEYYLKEAGGLGFDADRDRMVVINPISGGGISAQKAGELFDGEMLYVPRKDYGTKQ